MFTVLIIEYKVDVVHIQQSHVPWPLWHGPVNILGNNILNAHYLGFMGKIEESGLWELFITSFLTFPQIFMLIGRLDLEEFPLECRTMTQVSIACQRMGVSSRWITRRGTGPLVFTNYCHYPSGIVLMCTISSLDVLSSYRSDKSVQSQVQSLILETPSLFLR